MGNNVPPHNDQAHSSAVTGDPYLALDDFRRFRENYAATRAEPIPREAAPAACFSFSQAATSSGSKRTDPELRNDGILPLAAIL
jgi:hypothetical protein